MNELETGLRILARIIARAYLEELAQERTKECSVRTNKEEDNANGASEQGSEASPDGRNNSSSKAKEPDNYTEGLSKDQRLRQRAKNIGTYDCASLSERPGTKFHSAKSVSG